MQSMRSPAEIRTIKVQILLTGGHEYTVYLQSDSPLLRQLLGVLVNRSQNQANGHTSLFQIPIDEGRAALCFPSENLVGLVTEPPAFVQLNPAAPQLNPEAANILSAQYIQIDNFLTHEEQTNLIAYTLQKESAFVSTGDTTNTAYYPDHRNSLVLYHFPEFDQFLVNRVRAILPDVLIKLGIPSFEISIIEAQLTAHNDGNYYRIHNDNSSPETAPRQLTYVYYFYQEPKAFSGGELLIYDTKVQNNRHFKTESFKTVEPRNNSIVFFPSHYMHEVLPVSCPSKAFTDSRFTINGWVRR